MQRWTLLLAAALLLLLNPALASAGNTGMKLYVNGEKKEAAIPLASSERILYIPVPVLVTEFGFRSEWDEEKLTGEIIAQSMTIQFEADRSIVQLDGKPAEMPSPAKMIDRLPHLPLAWLGEQLGWKVQTDPWTRSVFVYMIKDRETKEQPPVNRSAEQIIRDQNPGGSDALIDAHDIVSVHAKTRLLFAAFDDREARFRIDGPVHVKDATDAQTPEQIVLELAETSVDAKWLAESARWQLSGSDMLRSVTWHRTGGNDIRLVLELERAADYVVFQDHNSSEIVVQWSGIDSVRTWTIMIDPGHGGEDPGAEGASGRYEKHFTLDQSIAIAERLRKESNIRVLMTRIDDSKVELEQRAQYANQSGADLFLSIHGNHFDGPVSGTESYYYHDDSERFAALMHKHVQSATGFADRGLRQERFKVLRQVTMPAVLLELGYLSHADEEREMNTEAFHNRVAEAIAAGVAEYIQNDR